MDKIVNKIVDLGVLGVMLMVAISMRAGTGCRQ